MSVSRQDAAGLESHHAAPHSPAEVAGTVLWVTLKGETACCGAVTWTVSSVPTQASLPASASRVQVEPRPSPVAAGFTP